MKNLRKILVALAVLALLVSSVTVLVVTADDEAMQYTGDLARAQELLADVPSMDRTDSTTDLRKEAIKKVYNYLRAYPVDPETEGYGEFEAELYSMSSKILNRYYDKLLAATADKDKQKHLETVLNYFGAFPIPEGTPDPDGDGEEYISYDEIVSAVHLYNYNMVKGYYDKADKSLTGGDAKGAMSSLKSLYVHVAKFPLDSSVAGAADLCKNYNLLSLKISEDVVADLEEYKEAGDNAAYKTFMAENLGVLKLHRENCPVDLTTYTELTERYDAVTAAISVADLDQIIFLFEDYQNFEPDENTGVMPYPELARAAALAKVSKALADSTIPGSTEGYAELVENIKAEEVKLAAVKEARRLALAEQAKLYEYDLTNNMSYKTFSADSESMGNPNSDEDEYSERVKTFDNGMESGYEAYWRYVCLAAPASPASYAELKQPNITNGFVHSFDFMVEGTNGTHYDYATFSNEWQNAKGDRLVNYGSAIFRIGYDSATDSVKVYNIVKTGIETATVVKNVAAEGQWFNVMLTYDPITHYGKLYIDYEYMFDVYMEGWVEGATRTVIRCSHSTAWQNTCYDNVQFYEGTAYRDVNKFDGMSDAEFFEYYVNYFYESNNDSKSRNAAYQNAKILVEAMKAEYEDVPETEMTDEQKKLKELVAKLESFDYNKIVADEVKKENLEEIKKQVAALEEIPPYSSNVAKINSAISVLDQFIATNNEFINKADPAYNAEIAKVNAVKARLSNCENAVAFAALLTQFERATTVASMTKRAEALNELYKLARYDKTENVEAVKNDPVFTEFEKLVNGKDAVPGNAGYITAFEYYGLIPDIIAQQEKVENSGRIIKCIELLVAMEGYSDTEEFWAANFEDVEFYISVIRDIVSVNNYDPSYSGVSEAIAKYELIDSYFYKELQKNHISVIGTQLDKFAESSSYIEKIGICTYIERYFASNSDIDLSLPEIQEFLYRLDRYKVELETYMDDYKELLERNTQYFIDTVEKMKLLTTYAELKPLYDEALSYYYAMNAITDEAKAAVAVFDEFDKKLIAIQTNSELFIKVSADLDFVSYLDADAEYLLLSECAAYYEYVDVTYSEGIAARMQLYEGLAAAYNTEVDTANEALDTSLLLLESLRSKAVPVAILAVVNQLYKN